MKEYTLEEAKWAAVSVLPLGRELALYFAPNPTKTAA